MKPPKIYEHGGKVMLTQAVLDYGPRTTTRALYRRFSDFPSLGT